MTKLILYLSFFLAFAIKPTVPEIRELYIKSENSEDVAKEFYQKLERVKLTDDAILVGYKAASLTLKAKFATKVKDKKEYFKKGAAMLETVIANNTNNIELRLIRFSVQENSPKLLKYKSNIDEDKTFIYSQLPHIKNLALLKHIKGYVSQSKAFSTEEKNVISKL